MQSLPHPLRLEDTPPEPGRPHARTDVILEIESDHRVLDVPYHALGGAHRRLTEGLPDNSLYLRTSEGSLWDALRALWTDARLSNVRPAPVPLVG